MKGFNNFLDKGDASSQSEGQITEVVNGQQKEIKGLRKWMVSTFGMTTLLTVLVVLFVIVLFEMTGWLRFNKKTILTHVRHAITKDQP